MNNKPLNRINVVLAESHHANKWLAEQLGVSPVTVSKWCTNSSQPDLQTLNHVAGLLNANVKELLVDNK